MSLSRKINELNDIKQQIKDLYKHKEEIERQIIQLVKEGSQDTDDFVAITEIYTKHLDHEKLRMKYPKVYEWGLTPKFDYKTALLSFDDKKMFWQIINECQYSKSKRKLNVKRRVK